MTTATTARMPTEPTASRLRSASGLISGRFSLNRVIWLRTVPWLGRRV